MVIKTPKFEMSIENTHRLKWFHNYCYFDLLGCIQILCKKLCNTDILVCAVAYHLQSVLFYCLTLGMTDRVAMSSCHFASVVRNVEKMPWFKKIIMPEMVCCNKMYKYCELLLPGQCEAPRFMSKNKASEITCSAERSLPKSLLLAQIEQMFTHMSF